jgi:enoyl-CoA hydratase
MASGAQERGPTFAAMIDFEARGKVALITINRPQARNAVNGDVAAGLQEAVERLEADPDLWVGVIAGRGPAFSAGADLKEIAAGHAASLSTERGGFAGITRLPRAKPLIAAVDGAALAGGCEIVLACDLVVASTAASFGIPEVKRSLIAGAGGLFRLARVLPRNVAMELAITGDPIPAERAHALGLVNKLCEPGGALDAALELAAHVSVNAPVAVQLSRAIVLEGTLAGDEEAWRMTDAATREVMATEDFAEGPRAFIEKREPVWAGR